MESCTFAMKSGEMNLEMVCFHRAVNVSFAGQSIIGL